MRLIGIACGALLASAACAAGAGLEDLAEGDPLVESAPPGALVVDGRPAATIVVRELPTEELVFAARTLQDYLQRISGAVLPVATDEEQVDGNRLLVGLSDATRQAGLRVPADIDPEGYVLRRAGRDIAILGGSDRGTVYGVAGLLHDHLGVRWYVPGDELGTCVPEMTDIALTELDELREPSFPMRWIGRGTDWALLNRQNCHGDSLAASFKIEPGIYHTQGRLLPHSEHFEEHPEYYALIGGERSEHRHCKLCYSSDETASAVADAMSALLEEDPGIDLLSFSPTDGQLWCECEHCTALDEPDVPRDRSMSRRSLIFYNKLAERIRQRHPDAEMLVGAYNVYNWPPEDRSITADPMLSVIVTHYEDYCMAHPIADPTCPRNRRYVHLLHAWDRLGTPVYYYEYYWKVNWLDLPWPIVHCIAEDIPWFHGRGDRGVYTQFNPQNAWTLYPAYYVAAQLLWDVEADVGAIFDEMCDRLYGAAGPAVREYYRVMEDAFAEAEIHFPGHGVSAGSQIFTPDLLEQMRAHLDRARELADSDVVQRRLAKLELSYQYTDRLMAFARLRRSQDLETAERALEMLEELVTEVRADREKWDGVVSTSVVREGSYLGRDLNNFREHVEKLRAQAATGEVLARLTDGWRFRLDPDDVGVEREWFAPALDDSDWDPIEVGKPWEEQGYPDYDGHGWYRLELEVRPEWLERGAVLHFGAVDGEAWVYLNGEMITHHEGWDMPFTAPLHADLVNAEETSLLAVRVWDGSHQGGIWQPVSVTVPEPTE
ncbi:MAG: DUF4838 domain-containing protein [Armatimonadota bacterium]|nr:DUF4838 domain-containing protein [Armatimonadota bacterium]